MRAMHQPNSVDPCVLVIFGASGDLTRRKLIPSLYALDLRGQLPEQFRVLGTSRSEMSDDAFRDRLREAAVEYASGFDSAAWDRFARRLFYQRADGANHEDISALLEGIRRVTEGAGLQTSLGSANVLFYLAVAPHLFIPIIENIGSSQIVTEGKRWCAINPESIAWQRIIVEKPFGEDLQSARQLNQALGRVFEEEQIYRIDHYLGKELVQNLLVLRFANAIFEPLWNREHIDHVQISAIEEIGVGDRAGSFFDRAGAVRDMIQSHLLQVASLVAMEVPAAYSAEAIMREKIEVMSSAKVFSPADAPKHGVLGRYGPGENGIKAYQDLEGVDPERRTETYGAIRVEFDTWRWSGVPFYVRSGKCLARKMTEILVMFKFPPTNLFKMAGEFGFEGEALRANRLIINIDPSEGISLRVQGKVPGAGLTLEAAKLDLDYVEYFGGKRIDAYGPLLLDAMRGDRTLFKHRDEVEAGWAIVEPFLQSEELRAGIQTYAPGSWGPAGADEMMRAVGRRWHNPTTTSVR